MIFHEIVIFEGIDESHAKDYKLYEVNVACIEKTTLR